MSRKIQEFFKLIPQKKALESIKDEKIHQEKTKNHLINFQECQMFFNDMEEKIIDVNEEFCKRTKNLSHKCRFCEKELANSTCFLVHMKKLHPEQIKSLLECQICERRFIKNSALEQHMKVKHFDGKLQLFECDYCGRSTKRKGDMKNHMKVHLPTVNCDICQAEFKQSSIKYHMKETHAANWKLQCKMCPKMFKGRTTLWNHQKIHDKKFQCTACMKIFSMKCKLLKHQKDVHENPGSYSCEVCDKKFNEKRNLQRHLKVHDRYRPKPLKCNRCDYETDNMNHFKRHQKGHVRQHEKFAAMKNPLKCPKCPNLIRDKYKLKQHLNAVHPDEPFQCDLCGRYLKTFSGLKNHFKLLHQQRKYL